MHLINIPQTGKKGHFPTRRSPKTYVDDMRAGVLVIDANEKVYHELGAVIHVQLGDDILQPPQFS